MTDRNGPAAPLRLDASVVPLRIRVLQEVLDQSTRLATGAVLMCAVAAGMRHSQGPDLADALGSYIVDVAFFVFLLSLAVDVLHWRVRSQLSALLVGRRGQVDAALALLVTVNAVVRIALVVVSPSAETLALAVPYFGAWVVVVVRAFVAPRRSKGSRFLYATSSYVIGAAFAGLFVHGWWVAASAWTAAANVGAIVMLAAVAVMRVALRGTLK